MSMEAATNSGSAESLIDRRTSRVLRRAKGGPGCAIFGGLLTAAGLLVYLYALGVFGVMGESGAGDRRGYGSGAVATTASTDNSRIAAYICLLSLSILVSLGMNGYMIDQDRLRLKEFESIAALQGQLPDVRQWMWVIEVYSGCFDFISAGLGVTFLTVDSSQFYTGLLANMVMSVGLFIVLPQVLACSRCMTSATLFLMRCLAFCPGAVFFYSDAARWKLYSGWRGAIFYLSCECWECCQAEVTEVVVHGDAA